ncbi:hypothetical protein FSARC_8914 [Fusarium sarcochroum]|uniref:Uncharacterized protein n=1 Tax=Fusarium sarcochroum TaxID=1208366 RepID=A0A8H4TS14_9HYPO|nr:hypothetical protein FSARC_8914 [Fusarium sarcochroum]
MFILADKYDIRRLQTLSIQKYIACLRDDRTMDPDDFVRSISYIYESPLEVSSSLRNGALVFARMELSGSSPAEDMSTTVEELILNHQEFARDLLFFLLRYPLMGSCGQRCTGQKPVPIEILGGRCLKCQKGGARTSLSFNGWQSLLEIQEKEDEQEYRNKLKEDHEKMRREWNQDRDIEKA